MRSLPYDTFMGALLAVLVSMETTNAVTAWPCPFRCECDSRQQTVRCTFVSGFQWPTVPDALPRDLRSLHISDQNITVVNAFSQSNLVNLRKVEIVRSNIRELQDNALAMAPKLRRLSLSENYLSTIPRAVSSVGLLRELVLNNNFITVLTPADFQNLTKLRILDLSINDISRLPLGIFNPLTELKRLNLSYNTIEAIHDTTFKSLTQLEDLSLSQNRIEELSPTWMDSLLSLWILEMNGAIAQQSQTVHLLPETSFSRYPHLQQVRLAGNKIRDLPCDSLRTMHGLELLDLSHNNIGEIPNLCFWGMISLTELLLIANEITHVGPRSFDNVTSLMTLDLSSNKLQSLEPFTFGWTRLNRLYMNENNFRVITNETFAGAYGLSQIFLRSNEVMDISPEAFWYNGYLQAVDLRENNLTAINSEFINLTYLTFLAFTGNDISQIQINAFEGTSIQLIYLHNNSLTTLPESILSYMTMLNIITLNGNPWHCDCKIRYLCETIVQAMETGEYFPWVDGSENMRCATPKSFQEMEMGSAKPFNMICTTLASALAIQLIVGLSLSAVAISTALYVVQLYCKAKKLERNGSDTGKCLA